MKINWEKPEGKDWDLYVLTLEALYSFSKNAAPNVFTWLGWCALLSVIRYVELKTGLWPFTAIQWLLGILLWLYFTSFFSEAEAKWMPRHELLSSRTLLTSFIGFLATAGLVGASFWLARMFMTYPL